MQQNELMIKKIQKNTSYFDEIYTNRSQYKTEWAFQDAQARLDDFVNQYKDSACCNNQAKKHITKKAKRSMIIQRIFKKMRLLMTASETIISALFVLVVSELSHSAVGMIESHTLSLYFLGAFAVIKVMLENNFIRPVFERLSWNMYRRSYQMVYIFAAGNVSENQDVDTASELAELEVSYG